MIADSVQSAEQLQVALAAVIDDCIATEDMQSPKVRWALMQKLAIELGDRRFAQLVESDEWWLLGEGGRDPAIERLATGQVEMLGATIDWLMCSIGLRPRAPHRIRQIAVAVGGSIEGIALRARAAPQTIGNERGEVLIVGTIDRFEVGYAGMLVWMLFRQMLEIDPDFEFDPQNRLAHAPERPRPDKVFGG